MSRRWSRAAVCVTALAAGCGGEAGDLLAIEVTGGPAGARDRLDIVVASDGRGSCNAGAEENLPSEVVIEAREVERELSELAERGATYDGREAGRRRYVVRLKAGTVRWVEGQPDLPPPLPRAQLLALRLDRQLCRN